MNSVRLKLDRKDRPLLDRFTFFFDKDGFPRCSVGQRNLQILAVDLVLGNDRRKAWVEYKDGDKTNLKRSNLMVTSKTLINYRLKKRANTSSRYKGVSWKTYHQKWMAYYSNRGKQFYLGMFDSEEDANVARIEAMEKLLAPKRKDG